MNPLNWPFPPTDNSHLWRNIKNYDLRMRMLAIVARINLHELETQNV